MRDVNALRELGDGEPGPWYVHPQGEEPRQRTVRGRKSVGLSETASIHAVR